MNPKKELLWSLRVNLKDSMDGFQRLMESMDIRHKRPRLGLFSSELLFF